MATNNNKPAEGITPPPDIVEFVKQLVAEGTEQSAASLLGVGRGTVSRLRGGLPVRAGTIALVRERLAHGGAQ